ncbi:hypothetical protein ASPWEDRAFT_127582 [Aspergillus wentii DTO 134E9]|uniref:Uncharacterized protein n=1 Tax=Aspergillus wentii DTO 134E9 TaxID=1073089 RepID=A0A1L9RV52_ASPWE|nr:uncharacterized protein ASPWEDRAFT_127582 [Aspergillus wentii DTO 134E9]KAI9928712.1 hypothetical protein MW887_001929 [Aspergillus wentii]OJJ38802.1 hypothetical protein ASPWEDRAFT_127582 [Aspergillus wentii DTO 134E9]
MPTRTYAASVAGLPVRDPPPLRSPKDSSEIPSDDDMGFNDPQNIIYVNLKAKDLTDPKWTERINYLTQMLQLTHQLATIQTGIQVKDRKAEGVLPDDMSDASQWKRSEYRHKVMDTYFKDGVYTWCYSPQETEVEKHISVDKTNFHWELLKDMLAGIIVPGPIESSLEAIFKGITDTILKTEVTTDKRSFWSLVQVFTYDAVQDKLNGSLRNITYTLSQDMKEVTVGKASHTSIQVDFAFSQCDFSFNESTWDSVKEKVNQYIISTGIGNITDPPKVDV